MKGFSFTQSFLRVDCLDEIRYNGNCGQFRYDKQRAHVFFYTAEPIHQGPMDDRF